MKLFLGHIALLSLVLVSCKKEPLPDLPDANNPIYTITGIIDGNNIDVKVGDDDGEIEFGTDLMNGMPTYYGEISSPSQDVKVRIEMIQHEYNPIAFSAEELMAVTPTYLVHNPGCIALDFGSGYAQANNLLIETSEGKFEPQNTVQFEEFGIHTLRMKFTDLGLNTYEMPIKYGFEPNLLNPKFISSGNGDTLKLFSLESYDSHKWYLNDELVSEEGYCSWIANNGVHRIRHEIIDEHGNKSDYTTFIRFSNGEYKWQLQYDYCTAVAQSNYGKILISCTRNDVVYKSQYVLSNGSSILGMDKANYVVDMNDHPVLMYFNYLFHAKLEDVNGQSSLLLENMSGRVAVGLE